MKRLTCAVLMSIVAVWSLGFAAMADTSTPDRTVTIPDGTEITAVTIEALSSKTAHEDDPVTFKVNEDVIVDGSVVIAKGTILKGVVTNAKKSGHMGKGGQLNVRIDSTTTVDGQKLKVRAAKGKQGNDTTGSTIALTVLISPFFLLKHGKQAEIKEGTLIKVFTDEAKVVTVKDAAPTP